MKKLLTAALIPLCACVAGDETDLIGGNDENIINGTVDYGDPSVVGLFAHKPGETSGFLCTGTVISPTAVLTAAHCVDPAVVGSGMVFEVRTGTNMFASPPIAVASVVWDKAFDVNNLRNGHDIAIVKLAQPTTLAPIPYNRGALGTGSVRIVGYGWNTHLSNPLLPNGGGTKRTGTTTINSSTATLIHIGNTNMQTCHGDSGGPAFQTINGREVIVGVTSYGQDLPGGVVCVNGATDTRVDAYLPFIDANL